MSLETFWTSSETMRVRVSCGFVPYERRIFAEIFEFASAGFFVEVRREIVRCFRAVEFAQKRRPLFRDSTRLSCVAHDNDRPVNRAVIPGRSAFRTRNAPSSEGATAENDSPSEHSK